MNRILPSVLLVFLFWGISHVSLAEDPVLEAHQSKLQGAKEYTLEVAHAMPEELFSYKPTVDEMSFGEQLLHIADNLVWLSSIYLSEKAEDRKEKSDAIKLSKTEIIQRVAEAYDFALHQIAMQDPQTLTKEFDWRERKMTKIYFLTSSKIIRRTIEDS